MYALTEDISTYSLIGKTQNVDEIRMHRKAVVSKNAAVRHDWALKKNTSQGKC